MARRHELSNEEWALVRPLLPARNRLGRPPRSSRQMLNGMLWILRTGAPWRDLPARYGPWRTVYHRFNQWRRQGVLDSLLMRLRGSLNAEGKIDWDLWCVDGTSVRASKSVVGGCRKGGLPNPRTTHWGVHEVGSEANSTS